MPYSPLQIILFLLLATFYSNSAHAVFGPKCNQAQNKAKPAWVEQGVVYQRSGFRYGFAEVRASKDKTYEQMLEQAAINARNNLATSISSEVDSMLRLNTTEEKQGGKTQVSESNVQNITVRTNVNLPGVTVKDNWQDPTTCTVYALVEISEVMLKKMAEREAIDIQYQQAKDEKLRINSRITIVKSAIEKTRNMDFSDIYGDEGKESRLHKYEALLSELEAKRKIFHNAVFIISNLEGSEAQLQLLSGKIKAAIPGSFNLPTACNSPAVCLTNAAETPANLASIATVTKQSQINEGGFWAADYTIDIVVRDLSNNEVVYRSSEKPVRVMSRQEYGLGFDAAFPKWLSTHENIFQELSAISK